LKPGMLVRVTMRQGAHTGRKISPVHANKEGREQQQQQQEQEKRSHMNAHPKLEHRLSCETANGTFNVTHAPATRGGTQVNDDLRSGQKVVFFVELHQLERRPGTETMLFGQVIILVQTGGTLFLHAQCTCVDTHPHAPHTGTNRET
jgi:hypothetical protein